MSISNIAISSYSLNEVKKIKTYRWRYIVSHIATLLKYAVDLRMLRVYWNQT